jgi:hypothetical protein
MGMKNTTRRPTDQDIKQDIADWLGITLPQLAARIALHRELTRIAAVGALRDFPTWRITR